MTEKLSDWAERYYPNEPSLHQEIENLEEELQQVKRQFEDAGNLWTRTSVEWRKRIEFAEARVAEAQKILQEPDPTDGFSIGLKSLKKRLKKALGVGEATKP